MRSLAILLSVVGSAVTTAEAQVALGTIELKGGTKTVTVSTAAIPTTGAGDMVGTIKNDLGTGQVIKDLTIEVRRKGSTGTPPNVGKITVTNGGQPETEPNPPENPAETGEVASFGGTTMPGGGIAGDASAGLSIGMVSPGTAADVEVTVTPSLADKPKNSAAHANTLVVYRPTPSEDAAHHAIATMWLDRLAFEVFNADDDQDITQLVGTVTFPTGSSESIVSVHLADPSESFSSVPGTSVSINGETFVLSSFDALPPDEAYEIVVILSDTMDGETVKILLEAVFD
ncbi:MAG: hypothetical protein ACF8XB_16675 [Planctomycetota bacterium JB042]